MDVSQPFVREAGAGLAVVCLHCNASSSSQWRELLGVLSPNFHVLAPDSYGAGKSIDWPSDRTIALDDEVDFIEPVLKAAGESFFVVAHSYGAAVALKAALRFPKRIRAMVLYEPALFSLVDAESPAPNAADGIRKAVEAAGNALDDGNSDKAAEYFIDYWMGQSSWESTPDSKRSPIAASIANVRRWGHALFTDPVALSAFGSLDIPVLYMVGEATTQSALGVARLMTGVLPHVEILNLEGLGHMGPITHPQQVNAAIVEYLYRTIAASSN